MITVFKETAPTLEEAQKMVGGLVEMVHVPNKPNVQVLVNESGLLEGLEFNSEASKLCGQVLVGPAILLEGDAVWT
jgi:hypothetical protein